MQKIENRTPESENRKLNRINEKWKQQEIRESTATSLSEYRLLVAEFGLLDAQLANLTKLVAELTGEEAEGGVDGLVIDEDELEVQCGSCLLVCASVWFVSFVLSIWRVFFVCLYALLGLV